MLRSTWKFLDLRARLGYIIKEAACLLVGIGGLLLAVLFGLLIKATGKD